MSFLTQQREVLLSDVQYTVATLSCKKYTWSRIGRDTRDLDNRLLALMNYEFVLCGKDLDQCELDCVKCAVEKLKIG